MNALAVRIAQLIEKQGPLSVAQFMTIALHDPEDGYYANRDPLGAHGDFVTAPEISQMFGELIGFWCVQVWRDQGSPKNARLMELGPGRGTLMADILRAASRAPDFLANIEVVLVEASRALRAIQEERLKNCSMPVTWMERYDGGERPLFLVANEFFDALPIRQYVRTERGWCERMVVTDEKGGLAFALSPTPSLVPSLREAPPGGVIESAPAATALADDIGRTVARCGGAALVIDYGYAETGFGETLQAVGRHQFKDILEEPGNVDLSAHVDFAGLSAAAVHGGAKVSGPIGQGAFLERLGLATRADRLVRENPDQADAIAQAVDRLAGPAQMGALFKALAIMPPHAPDPPGF